LEPKTGVFLGNPSARVRDELWQRAVKQVKEGSVLQIWTDSNPQGFSYRQYGVKGRRFIDIEGVSLVSIERHPTDSLVGSSSDPKKV
jgi:CRISPR-associated protein Cas2